MKAFFWTPASAYLRFHDLRGHGPTLVLLHGLGASGSQAFVDACRYPPLDGARCVAPDLLGFGHSDRPRDFSYSVDDHAASVIALLEHLDLRAISLVGHSMGGAVAIVAARERPDLIARLILLEGHLDPVAGAVSGPVAAHSEAEFARRGHADLVRRHIADGFDVYAGAFQAADPVAIHRSAVSLITPRRPTFREMLVELTIPRVFLFGGESTADPDVRWLLGHGVPVRFVDGAGHDMAADQPAAFAAQLGDALR